MREKQFDGLRTKLLQRAAEFYGRLEDLVQGQAHRESRGPAKAYDELGELTEKIGEQAAALALHLKALDMRRALTSEPGADLAQQARPGAELDRHRMVAAIDRRHGGGEHLGDEARELAKEVEKDRGAVDWVQEVLTAAYRLIARVLSDAGDTAGAQAAYREELATRQKLADTKPSITQVPDRAGRRPSQNAIPSGPCWPAGRVDRLFRA